MTTPKPSALTLTAGLSLTVAGGVLALFGGAMLWAGLVVGLIGAYQTITGVYRLAAAVDYIAARPVVRRVVEPTVHI